MSGDNPASIATDGPDGSTSRTISGSLPIRQISAERAGRRAKGGASQRHQKIRLISPKKRR